MSWARKFPSIGLVLVAAGCAYFGAVATPSSDPSGDPCGASGTVSLSFELPKGVSFWDVFPDAGKAPELEGVEGLRLIIYKGPVELHNLPGIPDAERQPIVQDAVCVVLPDGNANLYYEIPRTNMHIPTLPQAT